MIGGVVDIPSFPIKYFTIHNSITQFRIALLLNFTTHFTISLVNLTVTELHDFTLYIRSQQASRLCGVQNQHERKACVKHQTKHCYHKQYHEYHGNPLFRLTQIQIDITNVNPGVIEA